MHHDRDSMLMVTQEGWQTAQKNGAAITKKLRRSALHSRRRLTPNAWHCLLMIGDSVLLIVSLLLAVISYSYLQAKAPLAILEMWHIRIGQGIALLLLWTVAAVFTQAYNATNISNRLSSVFSALCALILTYSVLIASFYTFIHTDSVLDTRSLTLCLLATIPGICLWHWLLAEISILPRFRSQAVIVGANGAGIAIASELQSTRRPRITLLGYLHQGSVERTQSEILPMLGDRSMLHRLVQENVVDMIITAANYYTQPELMREAIEAAQHGITVLPMAIAYERICGKLPIEHIDDQWYATLPTEGIISPLYLCWQKTIDMIFSLVCMALLFLVGPIIALLIYLDSPGPIFYHQERAGYQGKKFRIFKFRTMHTDAERAGRAVWAKEHDSRVTRVGRILRATHLDELPQAWNILRGEMSLIGPRPERQEFIAQLEKTIPFYRYRLMVRPGLTGWAQVKYRYASTNQDSLVKLQYDLYYIRHRSWILDVSIIFHTVIEMLFCRGV